MTPLSATSCSRASTVALLLAVLVYGLFFNTNNTGKLTAYKTLDRFETSKPTLTLELMHVPAVCAPRFFLLTPRLPPAVYKLIAATKRAGRRAPQQRGVARY
jgi:di/tricarboxylate transporter